MATEMIDSKLLASLVEAGAVRTAHVVGRAGGWGVVVRCGMVDKVVAAQRSHQPREWKTLETVVAFLQDMGLPRFDVDAVAYDRAKIVRRSRPDRSVALKRAHEAAAYDQWFREQVQAAIDDPRPAIPHAQVKSEWETKREALLKRVAK